MTVLILVILGLCLGSFVNALVWRIRQQETKSKDPKLSVISGRSMCPNCRHELSTLDLLPVFSWLALGGRCRYCKKPIAWQYPIVEAVMSGVFVASYYFWPGGVAGVGQWTLFVSWLAASVGLMALLLYDLRYMLLPSRILYPTLVLATAGRLFYILSYSSDIAYSFELLGLSLLVASGVFAVLFYISRGRWIGFGDVRLGLITGTLLATPAKSFLMIFLASLLGTAVALPAVASGRSKMSSRIPYGPFLIAATAITLLFGQSFINWYRIHFL
jgi:prepilin signal peptidase PulO-like enzyme (type II secretory pathway)